MNRFAMLIVNLFFVLLFFVSCSDLLPKPDLCNSNKDCHSSQRCIAKTCTAKKWANEPSRKGQEESFETSKESLPDWKEPSVSEPGQDKQSPSTDASESLPETPGEANESLDRSPEGCEPGSSIPCFPHKQGKAGVGICKEGVSLCNKNREWGMCIGSKGPQVEVCDDGLDNNCDGAVDEGCPCQYKGSVEGVCSKATIDSKGVCQPPASYSAVEKCDKLDNNCNGTVDENCPCNYLGKSQGVCTTGTLDSSTQCTKPKSYNDTEQCGDQLDNNCNGVVDENCSCNFTGKSVGVCTQAVRDQTGVCQAPSSYSSTERCGDKLDNDCNGVVDEGCPCQFNNSSKGVCGKAVLDSKGVCQAPSNYNVKEICGDKLDNNCDGVVDENCPCTPKATETCGTDVGICKKGTRTCSASGTWGACTGNTPPQAKEYCRNQVDDNCNGAVDEGCPCLFQKKNQGVCRNTSRNSLGICQQPKSYSSTEICGDKLDNNCNGVVDEGCPCNFGNNPKGVCGNAKRNSRGVCERPSGYNRYEQCNDSIDNNCSGYINEYCSCKYLQKNKGVCANAKRDGRGVCIAPNTYSANERCNDRLDNNCDGVIDEGCLCYYLNKRYGVCVTRKSSKGICEKPPAYQATEICGDQLDNNCNYYVDEYCPCNYGNNSNGVCGTSKRSNAGICEIPRSYGAELCDNKDNDCNGKVDDGLPSLGPCNVSNKRGECGKGERQCVQGSYQCQPKQLNPIPETCDGLDNDCDGQVDNVTGSCYGFGVGNFCRQGVRQCLGFTETCNISPTSSVLPCTSDSTCQSQCPTQPGQTVSCLRNKCSYSK